MTADCGTLRRNTANGGAGTLQLRSDNGLVFASQRHTTVRAYGLQQELITPHSPQQNGLFERFVRSLNEERMADRFESTSHARDVIGRWLRHYNTERPHQAVGYQAPAQLAAQLCKNQGGVTAVNG